MAQRYDLLVVREDNGKNYWTKIGVAFENKSGDGYQLRLDALPLSNKEGECRIIMKVPSEREGR